MRKRIEFLELLNVTHNGLSGSLDKRFGYFLDGLLVLKMGYNELEETLPEILGDMA